MILEGRLVLGLHLELLEQRIPEAEVRVPCVAWQRWRRRVEVLIHIRRERTVMRLFR